MNPKDKKELQKKIANKEDFVYSPKHSNSLKKILDRHPEGISDEKIQKVLLLSKEEFAEVYANILSKIREFFNKGN